MYLILIIALLSFSTTFTADQSPQAIMNELVNYGNVYFERILPVESQTETFKNNIKQIVSPCKKVLGFIDETLFKSMISSSGDRTWKENLLNVGCFSIDPGIYQQKVKTFNLDEKNHPLSVLNTHESECEKQNKSFDAQKFFMHDYEIPDDIFNDVTHQENFWFFTQLYWVGVIKCFLVEEGNAKLHRTINQNPLLQTATIIALFEECITSTIDTTIVGRNFDNINTFIVSSGTKFPYDNLIKFYITQFINNEKMQSAIKQSKKGDVVVKLLKIFKCSNIGTFPNNWEELFLPKPEALEENENLFNNIQIDNVLNPPNNNGVQEHNIPNPPRNNTWGKKELILSTIPGIALLFLSRFLKTTPIEMKQKIRWGGFISLISFPAITYWVSNRR